MILILYTLSYFTIYYFLILYNSLKGLPFYLCPENITFHVDTIYEITMNSFIYSFNIYLLNTYSVLVDTGDTVTNKTEQVSYLIELLF